MMMFGIQSPPVHTFQGKPLEACTVDELLDCWIAEKQGLMREDVMRAILRQLEILSSLRIDNAKTL